MPASQPSQSLSLFGLRLKDVRLQYGFPLSQCARRLGISSSHLCNLECGRREPSFSLLIDIATDLNVSLDYLILGLPDRMHDSALIFRSDDELLSAMVVVPPKETPGNPKG